MLTLTNAADIGNNITKIEKSSEMREISNYESRSVLNWKWEQSNQMRRTL